MNKIRILMKKKPHYISETGPPTFFQVGVFGIGPISFGHISPTACETPSSG